MKHTYRAPLPVFSALDLISPRDDSLKQDGAGAIEIENASHWTAQNEKRVNLHSGE